MAVRIVRHLDECIWKEFVDNHPKGNIFHTPEMFHVFARTQGHRPTLWAAVSSEGQVLAILSTVEITINNFLRPLSTRAVAYGSVLCEPSSEGKDALVALLQAYAGQVGRSILFTELRNLSDMDALQPLLHANGFIYENHLNYIIDLDRPAEAIFQDIGRRTRKNIRHGLNRGEVIIEHVTNREQIKDCYQLLRQTYQLARVPLADLSLFESAFDLLEPKQMIRFSVAHIGQVLVAVSIELLYKTTLYGWYGGMDRAYSAYVPNELLMWHILKWGAENGYRLYDFGGAGKPDESYGVRDFKSKFGGTLVCYGRNTRIQNRVLMHISELGYKAYRRLIW